jgi:hypothetical protein
MKIQKMLAGMLLLTGLLLFTTKVFSQDPNFYIYLCFGQSNMEGYPGNIEAQDKIVNSRFRVMEAVNCSNLGRTKGSWYTAVPPLCRCNSGLTPADYFGKTMVANLPDSIKVGVINVSVAGCKIELFDKDNYQTYASTVESWMTSIINEYGGNPYARLVEIAKLAQKDGVIRGILLHQGESNTGETTWPSKVKGVYDNLINDLGLKADSVPLLAGEVVNADQGGSCAFHNTIIAKLPQTIPNSYVISSSGCTQRGDNLHFTPAGYRELGRRYATKMLSLLGYKAAVIPITESLWFESECATVGDKFIIAKDADASNGCYVMVQTGLNSLSEAPADNAGTLKILFKVSMDTTYNSYARLNCASADSDSYWVKIDDKSYGLCDSLTTSGWQWIKLTSFKLSSGNHTLAIAYRENGAKLDKICVSNSVNAPTGKGDKAGNFCTPVPTVEVNTIDDIDGYSLDNYPNPFHDNTTIVFEIPNDTYVSLKVYDMFGSEIAELAGKKYAMGKHTAKFNTHNFAEGFYFYKMKAGNYTLNRKMILQGK